MKFFVTKYSNRAKNPCHTVTDTTSDLSGGSSNSSSNKRSITRGDLDHLVKNVDRDESTTKFNF